MCGRFEIIDGKRVFTRFRVPTPPVTLVADNRDVRSTTTVPTIITGHELAMMR